VMQKRFSLVSVLMAFLLAVQCAPPVATPIPTLAPPTPTSPPPTPKGESDNAMAQELWQELQEANYQENWATISGKGTFYQGQPPHGALLSTYLNPAAVEGMNAKSGQMSEDAIIVKENYMPDKTLVALTVMYKEPGYDPEHGDWFWAKFSAEGEVQAAGKVADCIACHGAVQSNDYIFTFPIALRP
jgi:hypothetical protein